MMQWWVRLAGTIAFCGPKWILRRSMQNFWSFRTGNQSICDNSPHVTVTNSFPVCRDLLVYTIENSLAFRLACACVNTKLYHFYKCCLKKGWEYTNVVKTKAVCLYIYIRDYSNSRCRKLPKGLKEWQAFLDLKKTIDDFSESCPLLEMMANKSMMRRHWNRITDLTGHQFEVESTTFMLQNIMEAPLLKFKDDIEVCWQFGYCVYNLLQFCSLNILSYYFVGSPNLGSCICTLGYLHISCKGEGYWGQVIASKGGVVQPDPELDDIQE